MPDSRGNTVRRYKPSLPSDRVIKAIRRFHAAVRHSSGCWEWTRARNADGYGVFWSGDRVVVAHRFAYEAFVGEIPDGLELDHLCRNRGCVNPAHLEPVSHRLNVMRGHTIPARNAAKTRCPKCDGAYTVSATRGRYCKACKRATARRVYARQRAAA